MIFRDQVRGLLDQLCRDLHEAAWLDGIPTFDFPAKVPEALPPGKLQQRYTQRRTVYSLAYGLFQAREIVMDLHPNDPTMPEVIYRSEHLSQLVARGDQYAFDLIVEVGLKSLLECRRLGESARDHIPRADRQRGLWADYRRRIDPGSGHRPADGQDPRRGQS